MAEVPLHKVGVYEGGLIICLRFVDGDIEAGFGVCFISRVAVVAQRDR